VIAFPVAQKNKEKQARKKIEKKYFLATISTQSIDLLLI
jgi:hypothetical protein